MSLRRYPKYKASGVEWLGDVPEHWDVVALKRIVKLQSGDSITAESIDEVGPFPVLGGNGLRGYTSTFTHDGKFVIIGRQGALCGNINYAEGKFWASEHAVVASPLKHVETTWLGEMLRAMNLNQYSVSAAQPGLSVELVSNLRTAVPPIADQMAIASFLDAEITQIDGLIAEQWRLIELLKEKRQAVISHAVTKGLNPLAAMKSSPIEWLDAVPQHWEIGLLKRVFTSVDYGISDPLEPEGEIAVLRMGNIENGKIVTSDLKYVPSVDAALLLRSGDLLYNRTNSLDLIGKVGMFEATGDARVSFASYLVRLRLVDGCVPEYFAYLLNTEGILGIARATAFVAIGQCNLNPTRYGELSVAVPPREEQVAIVDYLHNVLGDVNALIVEAQWAIDILQERRAAVISAVVRGQMDVRRQAASTSHVEKPFASGFARQLLAAEILSFCHAQPTTGRVKLQKLIHLCEYVGELDEVAGVYRREAAGPFDNKVMFGVTAGLKKQKWFSETKHGARTSYQPLEKSGEHKKYLARWSAKMPKVQRVLELLGHADTQQCEIVSTLYAAWNDLLIEGTSPSDEQIIGEASGAVRWHASKAKISPEKWPAAIKWMREKGLTPIGFGAHTKRAVAKK